LYFLILFSSIFSASLLPAQKNNYRFQHYTSEDGLSQDNVDCILKDSRGFMWFGTWNGLNRFDAYSFTIFKADPEIPGTLSDNFIYDLAEDRFGNIWIATGKGLNVYLHEKDIFMVYLFRQTAKAVIHSNKINTLCFAEEDILWIGTDRGVDKVKVINKDGELDHIEHISTGHRSSPLTDNYVNVIYDDPDGSIWIGTNGGLTLLNDAQGVSVSYTHQPDNPYSLSNNHVYSVYRDDGGTLWVGTNFGLNRINPGSDRFIWYFHDPDNPNSLAHGNVQSICQDLAGTLIFGTLGGLSLYDPESDLFYNYISIPHSDKELNNEFVSCVFPDPQGNVWIGTDRGGVNKYNIYQTTFEYYEHIPGETNSLSHNTINSIFEDRSGLWVGTAGGGLNYKQTSNGGYQHFRYNPAEPGFLSSDFVTCILRDGSGNLWMGTWGGAINVLPAGKKEDGSFHHYQDIAGEENLLTDNFVSSMLEDRKGRIWIGTLGGLSWYDPDNDTFHGVRDTVHDRIISQVGCLHMDRYENLWIGTENGLFKKTRDRTFFYSHYDENPGSISGDYVISINEDRSGNLWFGTYGNGLNMISNEDARNPNPEFKHFSEKDGLANNTIYGILEDDEGNLWLSTDYGLSRYNPENGTFHNFYKSDGLPGNQFYWSACYKNPEGKLYFGGMNGLVSFYPDQISSQPFQPGLTFTDFKIYNQSVKAGEKFHDRMILQRPIWQTDSITLSHRISEFSVEFSSLYFDRPDKVLYAYMLEGFENEWRYVDSRRRFISYTNLDGGHYILKIKSAIEEGNWSPEILTLHIQIIPPFWVRTWFIITAVMALLMSLFLYNRYRVYSHRQREYELEQMVRERTAQIEGQKQKLEQQNQEILEHQNKLFELNKEVLKSNQLQMQFFTHMSHEFRTPLTLIISPIDQLIRELNRSNPHLQKLLLIRKNAQRLLHLINQLMEVRRIKTGNIELRAVQDDMVPFLENIMQSFIGLAGQKDI
ncbi:MAG TPA: hypothetical protein ENN61_03965, partial [Bacteroidaceae bacterium]|nr:hypothetical protein [Bacteroidaceae bacterium]